MRAIRSLMVVAPVARISPALIAVTGEGVTKPVRAMREPVTVTLSRSVVPGPTPFSDCAAAWPAEAASTANNAVLKR